MIPQLTRTIKTGFFLSLECVLDLLNKAGINPRFLQGKIVDWHLENLKEKGLLSEIEEEIKLAQ